MRFDARKPPFDGIEAAARYPPGLDQLDKDGGMFFLNLGNFGHRVNDLDDRTFDGELTPLHGLHAPFKRFQPLLVPVRALAKIGKALAHLGAHLLK